MANINKKNGVIGILTGGGDVPGLNPAIRAVTIRALREGYQVVGLRRGWAGIMELKRDKKADNTRNYQVLTEEVVNRAGRTGGTFLHSSRTRPSHILKAKVPPELQDTYTDEVNDLTPEVLKNLDFLGVDYLIPIGGDDTLSYAVRLYQEGVKVVAIPKTMDNDVPGTDYCMGFGTCVNRTIEMARQVTSSAASHERIVVLEVFGRYAGFTALLPTFAGAADRCLIPEHEFDVEQLTELLVADRNGRPEGYSVCIVSEGAMPAGGEMVFMGGEKDQYGHAKLGGIGQRVSARVKELAPQFNGGKKIDMISMNLGYLVRSGAPDAIDCIVPTAYGNLAVDLILKGEAGRMVALRDGSYGSVPIEEVVATKKVVDVARCYDTERYRPRYDGLAGLPLMVLGGAG